MLWNSNKFTLTSWWHMEGVVIANGLWGTDRIPCCILNIYASCPLEERIDLWGRLKLVIDQNIGECICLVGDFNSVCYEHERNEMDKQLTGGIFGRSTTLSLALVYSIFPSMDANIRAIDQMASVRAAWRFLVHNEWLKKWPDSIQKGLPRAISDHCPLLLETTSVDWGPRPFRFLNVWLQHPTFKDFVANTWNSIDIDGWAGVAKEK